MKFADIFSKSSDRCLRQISGRCANFHLKLISAMSQNLSAHPPRTSPMS